MGTKQVLAGSRRPGEWQETAQAINKRMAISVIFVFFVVKKRRPSLACIPNRMNFKPFPVQRLGPTAAF